MHNVGFCPPSRVPRNETCEGRYGVSVDEDVGAAPRVFGEAVAAAGARDPWRGEHPAVVELWRGQFQARIPVDDPIVGTVADAFAEVTTRTLALAVLRRRVPIPEN